MEKKKLTLIGGVIGVVIVFILIYFIFLSNSDSGSDTITQDRFDLRSIEPVSDDKKEKVPLESYYELGVVTLFAKPEQDRKTYIKMNIILAYPHFDHNSEKEIIIRRDQLVEIIKDFIAQKSFSQLNTAEKRRMLKEDILAEVNSVMTFPVLNIYYKEFFITQT